MIKFSYDLLNYKSIKVSSKIKRIIKIDRQKLQDGIDTFQGELDWWEMWTVEDSEKRLEDDWWFYVIEKDNKYIGWAWFDTSNKQFCNLYVHIYHYFATFFLDQEWILKFYAKRGVDVRFRSLWKIMQFVWSYNYSDIIII